MSRAIAQQCVLVEQFDVRLDDKDASQLPEDNVEAFRPSLDVRQNADMSFDQ